MISIFTNDNLKKNYFEGVSFNGVEFVDSKDKADFYIVKKPYDSEFFKKRQNKYICFFSSIPHSQRVNIRNGYCVDNRIENIPNLKNFCFSTYDFCNIPYIIPMPNGPTPEKFISQKPKYWLDYNIENTSYHNKVYWCGRIRTHKTTRKPFLQFYNLIDDARFNVSEFTKNIYKTDIDPSVFTNHIDKLSNSDAAFIIRGDRAWTHSFFDVIMSGCIPIMISSMNDFGWENIFENVEDYMLRFDLKEHSLEYIHEQVVSLLEDKERVLKMKANIRKFYNMFFKCGTNFGFSEFLLAKCVDIYKKDFDLNKVNGKFICSEILTLKGVKDKL
jgi:hypothetical protein